MFAWLPSLRRAPPSAAPVQTVPPPIAPPRPSAFSWLLSAPSPTEGPISDAERPWLQLLDRQLNAGALPADTLPRMPSVIPQLLSLLRQAQPSRDVMVRQVQKDALLMTEVLRVARSPFFGAQPVQTLETALDRIGTSGLQSALARLLLRPVFDAQGSGLLAKAASRLWQHSNHKALLCEELVAREGGDRFEAYLAALLHDAGWLALLRWMDRQGVRPDWPQSLALDAALDQRKDRLFGRITATWNLTPGLSALSRHLADPCKPAPSLLQPLRLADSRATADLAGASIRHSAL